jgi:hypothetical protein
LETNQGRPNLSSVGWCTGQSGAPPDSDCSCLVRDLLPILVQMIIAASGPLAHRTLSGAHRIVRCPLPTVGAGHAADRWLTGQSGAPPDSPVNYRRTPPNISRERPVHRKQAWRTEHCPMHHQIVQCAKPSWTLAAHSQVFCNSFFSCF